MHPALWREAHRLLPEQQYRRLRRMYQLFLPVAITPNTVHIFSNNKQQEYTIHFSNNILSCSCPDNPADGVLCKHLCWFLIVKGDGGLAAVRGISTAVDAAIKRARHNIKLALALDIEGDCPICYNELRNHSCTNCACCDHTFHNICMMRWLRRSTTCPMCRSSIT